MISLHPTTLHCNSGFMLFLQLATLRVTVYFNISFLRSYCMWNRGRVSHGQKKLWNVTEFVINQSAFRITHHGDRYKVFRKPQVLEVPPSFPYQTVARKTFPGVWSSFKAFLQKLRYHLKERNIWRNTWKAFREYCLAPTAAPCVAKPAPSPQPGNVAHRPGYLTFVPSGQHPPQRFQPYWQTAAPSITSPFHSSARRAPTVPPGVDAAPSPQPLP